MIKTHEQSRFVLKTLEQIRDTDEVILQIAETRSKFQGGQDVYLCEVVGRHQYRNTATVEKLSAELIAANEENRRLHRRIEKLEATLAKERKQYGN